MQTKVETVLSTHQNRLVRSVCNYVPQTVTVQSKTGVAGTFESLGYSVKSLCDHIEGQFRDGMSWDNYGKWHVDHIKPISSFSLHSDSDPEFREAWALSNLRPLWANQNLSKGKRFGGFVMGIRGRKSSQQLAIVSSTSPLELIRRPDPPQELTDEQMDEWRAIVNRMPADWFTRENFPLLAQYCRHIVNARKVAQLIAQAEEDEQLDILKYDKLLAMQEREGRAISSLATRMRLSQLSTYDRTKKKPIEVQKPWEAAS